MRMWLTLLAVAIPLGFIWFLSGQFTLGTPYTAGGLSALLFFWIVNLNEKRFSLRTMLIVTALVAVALGFDVWLLRAG